jgi:hypothetical protein
MGVRQIGQREGHGAMSKNGGRRGLTGTLIEGSSGLKHRNLAKRLRPGVRIICKTPLDGIRSKILFGMKYLKGG